MCRCVGAWVRACVRRVLRGACPAGLVRWWFGLTGCPTFRVFLPLSWSPFSWNRGGLRRPGPPKMSVWASLGSSCLSLSGNRHQTTKRQSILSSERPTDWSTKRANVQPTDRPNNQPTHRQTHRPARVQQQVLGERQTRHLDRFLVPPFTFLEVSNMFVGNSVTNLVGEGGSSRFLSPLTFFEVRNFVTGSRRKKTPPRKNILKKKGSNLPTNKPSNRPTRPTDKTNRLTNESCTHEGFRMEIMAFSEKGAVTGSKRWEQWSAAQGPSRCRDSPLALLHLPPRFATAAS